ncbi:MAG TPA: hypothetical protein VMU75_01210 [Acidimicrobiales bacterium]|nr:hypothetical protein [Acidimicrobiales bacterium]
MAALHLFERVGTAHHVEVAAGDRLDDERADLLRLHPVRADITTLEVDIGEVHIGEAAGRLRVLRLMFVRMNRGRGRSRPPSRRRPRARPRGPP